MKPLLKVDEPDIVQAVRVLAERVKLVVEGSGAAGLAALETGVLALNDLADEKRARNNQRLQVVIVLSGGNIDLTRWQQIVSD